MICSPRIYNPIIQSMGCFLGSIVVASCLYAKEKDYRTSSVARQELSSLSNQVSELVFWQTQIAAKFDTIDRIQGQIDSANTRIGNMSKDSVVNPQSMEREQTYLKNLEQKMAFFVDAKMKIGEQKIALKALSSEMKKLVDAKSDLDRETIKPVIEKLLDKMSALIENYSGKDNALELNYSKLWPGQREQILFFLRNENERKTTGRLTDYWALLQPLKTVTIGDAEAPAYTYVDPKTEVVTTFVMGPFQAIPKTKESKGDFLDKEAPREDQESEDEGVEAPVSNAEKDLVDFFESYNQNTSGILGSGSTLLQSQGTGISRTGPVELGVPANAKNQLILLQTSTSTQPKVRRSSNGQTQPSDDLTCRNLVLQAAAWENDEQLFKALNMARKKTIRGACVETTAVKNPSEGSEKKIND